MAETNSIYVTTCTGERFLADLQAETDHEAIRVAYLNPGKSVRSEEGDIFEAPADGRPFDLWAN